MQVVVVGPGALGCLLAVRLHLAGDCSVALLDHNPARAALLNRQGVVLEEENHGGWPGGRKEASAPSPTPVFFNHPPAMVPVSTDPTIISAADLVLLCVKAPAFAAVLASIAPSLPSTSLLLALQNGITHPDILNEGNLSAAWALGVTTEGATLLEPGRIRYGGAGLTELGFTYPPPPEVEQRLTATVALFNRAGLRAASSPDITKRLWRKLIINAGINALSVIHDCPNGELLEIPAARRTMAAAVREASAVAAACGIELSDDPVTMVEEVCRLTARNSSSMRQDVRRGKTTEIAAINGAVVRLAARHQLAVPVNRDLLATITSRHHPLSEPI